jgi:pyruvate formate lyase activating enzyme
MKESKYYEKINNNKIKCLLCNHFCVIENKKTGLCGVRQNENGKIVSLVYNCPVSVNSEAVEKKPLFHFCPGSNTLSLGTLGCNLKCLNCHNFEQSQINFAPTKIKKICDFHSPERLIEEACLNDCGSISYTYNEPTVFAEYALDIMKLAHSHDLKNIWVSNGYFSLDLFKDIAPYLDAINVDLKSFDNDFYKKNCGAKLDPVLNNLRLIKNEQIHLEVSTLLIPGENDDAENIEKIADFIANELDTETPWHILKFFPEISWKLKNKNKTEDSMIYSAYEMGKEAGLKYVYIGNMPGDQKENTYCPACGEPAIIRMGSHIERFDYKGRCPACDKSLDIIE